MRIRLPFTGTLTASYEVGMLPSFDQSDKMKLADDVIDGYAFRVLIETFDFEAGTVEVEVAIPPSVVVAEEERIMLALDGKTYASILSESRLAGRKLIDKRPKPENEQAARA